MMDALSRSYADLDVVKNYASSSSPGLSFVSALTPSQYASAVDACDNEWDKASAAAALADKIEDFTCEHVAECAARMREGNTRQDVVNINVRKCKDFEDNWSEVWDTLEDFDRIVCEAKCNPEVGD
jgi:hypothetical protein